MGKPSKGVIEAQSHMTKLSYMCQDKGLEAHPDKTGYILIKGAKKDVSKMEKELKLNPLKFGDFYMSRKIQDKYLGQILHQDGLAASVAATVAEKAGKFKGAVFEIRSVVEEYSMQTMGSMMAAKTLLERALLPSLLAGAGNWTGISKKTEEECDNLILMFWRVLYKIPESTPRIGIFAETATLRTKWRVWKDKILLVRRLQQQDSSSLARRVYETQLRLGLPGLAREVSEICDKVKIPNINFSNVKTEKIEENIFYHHYSDMKELIKSCKKMSRIQHEDFRREQDYMHDKSIDSSRTQLRVRLEMLETFKDNYRSKYRTLERGQEDRDPGLLCGDCGLTRDTQSHCLTCPAWAEDRDRLDLDCIEDLVKYFQRVLRGREDKARKARRREDKE